MSHGIASYASGLHVSEKEGGGCASWTCENDKACGQARACDMAYMHLPEEFRA